MIEVEWEDAKVKDKVYNAQLQITGYNRNGLINDILNVANANSIQLRNVVGRVNAEDIATVKLVIGIQNLADLKVIVSKVKKVPDVYAVKRVTN